jgi:ADP-ribosylglycohydrolase
MGTEALERLVAPGAARRADLEDLYRGVLLGVATGNALGIPVEGESRSAIRRHQPAGVTEIDPAEKTRPWDDDVAQTVLMAEALLERPELDVEDLGRRLAAWAGDNGRGMGVLTSQVVSELSSGAPAAEAARLAWERSGWSTAGNGPVTRCSPVALRWRTSGGELVRSARTSALVTHYDARCEWSTVALAVALAAALEGRSLDLGQLAGALRAVGGSQWTAQALEQVAQAVSEVPGRRLEELELDDPMDMGYTLKALKAGLWCLEQKPDFEFVVTQVVQAGGDADSNGAIAGAVMGARLGARAIPDRWLDAISGRAGLERIADRLLDAADRNA